MTEVQIISLVLLGVMFILSAAKNFNIGLLGFIASYIVGAGLLGLDDKTILKNFPGYLATIIIGVTLFFGMARSNGTIDLIVRVCIRTVKGRTHLVPWIFFLLASFLTAMGTFNPAAVALLAPAAMVFAKKAQINPLIMGVFLVNGVHAGGYSPISVAGTIVRDLATKDGIHINPTGLFLASYFINFLLSALTVLGYELWLRRKGRELREAVDLTDVIAPRTITMEQKVTLGLIAVLLVCTIVLHLSIGFVGIAAAMVLLAMNPKQQATAIAGVSWHTVIMIGGMMTYVALLQQAGVISAVSHAAIKMGSPMLVVLVLCLIIGLMAGFISSTALLTAFVPLATPILLSAPGMSTTGVIAALAIAGTIVDVSPFASDGALVIANTDESDRDRVYRQLLPYTGLVMIFGSLLTWALLVPTHIM